jgi:hypothetical protein
MGLKPRASAYRHLALSPGAGILHGYDILPSGADDLPGLADEIGRLEGSVAVHTDTDWDQMRPDDYAYLSWEIWKKALKKYANGKALDRMYDAYTSAFDRAFTRRR